MGDAVLRDPIRHQSRTVKLGKRLAPLLAGAVGRLGLMPALDSAAMYVHFVLGQGSGTGWDVGEYAVAAEHLRGIERTVVVDVGANSGTWTRKVRQRLGPGDGRWLLFEPAEQCRAELTSMDDVEVVPVAAGEHEEMLELLVPEERSGWMTLHERRDTFSQTKHFSPQTVRVVRLDQELQRRGVHRVDYLKLDIEGHELFALRGLKTYLQERRVAALAFEFGAANVNSRTFFRDFWDLLVPCGYRIARIAPGGRLVDVPAYYESLEYFRGATNYVAVAAHGPAARGESG